MKLNTTRAQKHDLGWVRAGLRLQLTILIAVFVAPAQCDRLPEPKNECTDEKNSSQFGVSSTREGRSLKTWDLSFSVHMVNQLTLTGYNLSLRKVRAGTHDKTACYFPTTKPSNMEPTHNQKVQQTP